jgi:hypothetical protein
MMVISLRCRRRYSSLGNNFSSFIFSVRVSTPSEACSFLRLSFPCSPPCSRTLSDVSSSFCGTLTRPRLFTRRGTRRRTEIMSQLSDQGFTYVHYSSLYFGNGIDNYSPSCHPLTSCSSILIMLQIRNSYLNTVRQHHASPVQKPSISLSASDLPRQRDYFV